MSLGTSESNMSKVPLIIILGATGSGKTKLGIELAQRFDSEIISADSMQLYKGLDIITAKATPEEQRQAKHHIIDILEPHQSFTVVDFRTRALKVIDELIAVKKPPIVVGGTNYYIESLLWNILVEESDNSDTLLCERNERRRKMHDDSNEDDSKKAKTDGSKEVSDNKDSAEPNASTDSKEGNATDDTKIDKSVIDAIKSMIEKEDEITNDALHTKLREIDPVMAKHLHPNNRRKIIRAMEVYVNTGKKMSQILEEQKEDEKKLRWPDNTIVFWLKADPHVHDTRLDARIDKMIKQGLIEELLAFHEEYNLHRVKNGGIADYTKGVFQTLGFRTFHDYLMLTPEERKSEKGEELLKSSIENMKSETKRYARRQNKMVLSRFLNHPKRELPPLYQLNCTKLQRWNENVRNQAITIIDSFIQKKPCKYEPMKPNKTQNQDVDLNILHHCDVCDRTLVGDIQYNVHLRSNSHARVVKMKQKN